MEIWDAKGNKVLDSVVTQNAEHVEELMQADYVSLQWVSNVKRVLPAGAYIVPFDDGVRYMLLDPYTPDQNNTDEFTYSPQFQHPKMYLGRVPYSRASKDTEGNDINLLDWDYKGYLTTFLSDLCGFITKTFTDEGITTDKFSYSVLGDIEGNVTISISNNDILSVLNNVCNTLDCEWHIDWEQRRLFVGNVRFDKNEGETLELTSGVNVGMASVSSQSDTYYNVYLPQGSTRNMAAATSDGSYYATNRRLELDPEKYPDGKIYTDGGGNVVTKEQFLEAKLPKLVQTLMLDEIYPKIDLYVYDVRNRERYLLDDNGDKVIDHYEGETPVYKRYAIWYMRLAYPIYNTDGTIRSWKDATLGDTFKLIDGYTLMCSFGANTDSTLTSPLAGREFELNYVETDKEAKELSAKADSDKGDTGVEVKKGDYEIIYTTEGNLIIPTTEEQGLVPKGESSPSKNGNKVTIFNVVMGEDFIKAAQNDLEVAAIREIKKQYSDLNQYTFNSDNVAFKKDMPSLYIGRSIKYNDGVGNTLDTRIMKLTTKLDFPFMVEITVGNKVLKGSTSQLKTDVQMILSGNRQTASNGITESVVRSLIKGFGGANFLSKVNDDTARGIITFLQGTNWGSFTSETGAAMTVDPTTGQTYMEVDRLKVRLKAFFEQLEVQKVGYVGGKIVVSKGQGVDILDVEEIYDSEGNLSAYRCYFLGEQEGRRINNLLRVNDQMICKDENISEGSTDGATNKYYWRLVTAVSSDVVKRGNNVCHWVDLSATDCDTNSDIPEIGDTICHLGNREDTDRQGAEILSVVDANSPSFTIYSGINSYSLVNKEYIDMGVAGGKAFCNIYGSTYIGDRNRENGYISWDYDKEENVWKMRVKGTIDISSPLSSGGTIGGAITDAANAYKGEFNNFVNNTYAEDKKDFYNQLDGKVETWYQKDDPKDKWAAADYSKHKGDIWYNDTTNKSYRWTGTAWVELKDQAAIDAKALAESKRRVFTTTTLPTPPYDARDLWVQGENGDIMVCVTPKAAGTTASASDWEKASKYTDDTTANAAKAAADKANTSVTELGNTVSGIYNLTDDIFRDRVIDKTERDSLQKVLADLEQDWADVASSYSKLTGNSLYTSVAADVRTDFESAYSKLKATYDSFVVAVNNVISATQVTDSLINGLYNNYENFKTDYAAYVSIMTVVTKQIDAILNKSVSDLVTELGGYSYLKKATAENNTLIEGGLILSTLIGLGFTDTNKLFHVMSGMSGIYDTQKAGNGIAFWAGGSMVDKQNDASENPAQFLVRHDGTGYAAGGNLWWEKNGKVHADPMSFIINEDNLGNLLGLFKPIYSGGSEYKNITGIEPLFQFTKLRVEGGNITNGELIGGLQIGDTAKFYIKDGVLFLDGDLAVTGGITMYASNGVTSGLLDQVYAILDSSKFEIKNGVITIKGDIGDGKVKGATLGGVAVTLNANGILEFDAYPTTLPASDVYAWAKAATKPTYSWGEITEKPSSFTPSAHTHDDRYYTESEIDTKLGLKLDTSLKGAADGLATLDSSGKVPSSQLPSYVDDVLECTNKASFPTTGESGKIYIDQTTNLTYRWGGSAYVEISQSLALGETSSTAYAGDKGKKNAEDIAALKTGKADKATTLSGYGITDAYTKTEVNTKLTDGSVTKIGTKDVGSATLPIYLKAGVPTAVGTSLAVDITGNSATATKLANARTLWGQSFDGSANVSGDMTGVGTITPTGNDLKVVGNLIVTGGIVMYADDGATIESGFAALLAAHIDGVTIKQNNQGKIYSVMTGIKVNGTTYKPSDTDGYITIPDYPTSLDWENIENKPSTFTPASHTHTFASLTSKPTTLSGYGITDAKIADGVITLGTATITPLTAHQTVTLASGTNNGTLKLTVGSKTTDNIAVKGLGSAAYTASSAYAAASHTHSQYLVASSLDGYVNALTDNTSANVFVTAIAKSGKTLSYTKSFTKKSLTAASHSGWSSADTDKLIIPDMSFIAYWNGAYNSDGGSNLAYCNKGAFGDMATASKSSYYTKSDTYTKTEVNTKLTDGSVTKVGTANVGATNIPIYLKAGVPTAVTLVDTANNLINNLTTGTSTPEDADYYVAQYVGGGTTTTTFHRRPHSALYAYIKGKAEGTWAISVSGNAATATTLQTARTLWGQSFNGSANISGNMSGVGQITFSALSGTNGRALLYQQMADNDFFRIYAGGTGNNGGYAEIATADDGNEPIYVRQYSGVFGTLVRTLTLLDGNGNTTVPGLLTAANGTVNGTLKVGAIPVTNSSTGVLKIDGNLIVTGGITMYATDGVASGLMEQILVDGTTIGKKADGTLYAINTGNVRSIIMGSTTYTPNGDGAVTLPEKVTWANIEGKPSTFAPSEHNHFDRYNGVNIDTGLNHNLNRHYEISNATGTLPFSSLWHQVYVMGGVDSGYTTQICTGLTEDTPLYFRHRTGGNWYSWRTILDSGNFGDYAAAKSHTHAISDVINLQATLDGKAAASHTHSYLPLSGGTMTGALNFTNNTWNLMGDDAYIGDCNVAGMIGVKGANAATPGFVLYNNSGTLLGKLYASGGTLVWDGGTIQTTTFSGNTSSATKLQTARTIWGQSFDGTGNVSGFMKNVSGLVYQDRVGEDWTDGINSHPWYGIDYRHCMDSTEPGKAYTSIASYFGLYFKTGGSRFIFDGGNVGIGTTSPVEKLDVNGNIISGNIRIWGSEVTNNSKGLFIQASDKTNRAYITYNGNVENTSYLNICSNFGNIVLSSYLNIGIGTTSPSYKLHVNGTLGVTGITTFNINNQWLTPSVLQIGRTDDSQDASKAVIGVTNGNLHIDAYHGNHIFLNYYNRGKINFGYQTDLYYISEDGSYYSGNSATATKLTSSAGSATLPIYFSDGKPVACTASSVFSNLSNSGNNISVTVAGQNRTLTVGYASNADTVDGFHYSRFVYNSSFDYHRNGPYYKKIASVNIANWTWSSASLVLDIFSSGYSEGICYLGTVEVTCGHWNNTDHNPSVTCRWVLKVPNSTNRIVTVKNLDTNTIDVYLNNDLWDCGITFNVIYNNNFSILGKSLADGGYVNLPTASDTVVHYALNNPTYVGNSSTASKWATARKITLTGSVTGSVSIDGSGDVTLATTTNHTHSYAGSASAGGAAYSANKLTTARSIFGQNFDGSAAINGQGVFYGTYNSTANARYGSSALQIRENGLVTTNQSDLAYAPSIGFHWGGRTAATLLYGSDSVFYLRKQDFTTRASLDANLVGNAATASKWATARTITLTGSVTGSVSIDGSGNVSLATTTNHTHAYLPLSGGTMTGQIQRAGQGSSWIKGRDNAMIRVNSKSGYSVLSSIKTTNGSWEIGHYDASGYNNNLLFGYYTDDDYSANNNNGRTKITFTSNGQVTAAQFNGALNGNAATASAVKDVTNGRNTYLDYAEAGVTSPSWLCAWNTRSDNTYEIRAISPTNMLSVIKALPLAGGTMTAGARISHADGNLYLGRADNNGWVMCQDMCSQTASGDTYWSLRTNGTFHALTTSIGGNLWLNKQDASSSTGGASQLVFGLDGNQHVVISSNKGAVIINPSTSSSTGQLVLRTGTSSTSEFAGNIKAGGGITMYSDLRKKNILSDEVLSVKEIAAAPLFRHTYKSDDNQYIHVGTSAQYWSSIHEDWFTRKDGEGYYQMELQNLGVAMGISLAREIVKYESKTDKKIRLMRKKINDLEARIKELEGSREERRTA